MNTDNCPQEALRLVTKVFDDGVAKFGDANTCNMPPDDNFKIAEDHMSDACNSDNPVDHITKAICRLMLALNVSVKIFDALHPDHAAAVASEMRSEGYDPDITPYSPA